MSDIKRISPAEAMALVDEGWVYLDVRSEPEFAAGHPRGAHNVPVMHLGARGMLPNTDFLAVIEALYPRDSALVLGCRSGQRSMHAARMLVEAGYTRIVDQRAGFEGTRSPFGQVVEQGWSGAGLPVETRTPGGSYAELRQKAGR
jgi:rhodanese-related sulfurtransferase